MIGWTANDRPWHSPPAEERSGISLHLRAFQMDGTEVVSRPGHRCLTGNAPQYAEHTPDCRRFRIHEMSGNQVDAERRRFQ